MHACIYVQLLGCRHIVSFAQVSLVLNACWLFCVGSERKVRKKRRLVIDELKSIASETMKMQLSDTSEIVSTLDLAPPTKKLMHWKETGGVEKLFAFPGRQIVSRKLSRVTMF